jgi:hypothetical protein
MTPLASTRAMYVGRKVLDHTLAVGQQDALEIARDFDIHGRFRECNSRDWGPRHVHVHGWPTFSGWA